MECGNSIYVDIVQIAKVVVLGGQIREMLGLDLGRKPTQSQYQISRKLPLLEEDYLYYSLI